MFSAPLCTSGFFFFASTFPLIIYVYFDLFIKILLILRIWNELMFGFLFMSRKGNLKAKKWVVFRNRKFLIESALFKIKYFKKISF